MKHVQVIDGANNCTYSIYALPESDFSVIFPNGTDVEFIDELLARISKADAERIFSTLWDRPVEKMTVQGIHGTLFYELEYKKFLYPTKKEAEMVRNVFTELSSDKLSQYLAAVSGGNPIEHP